MVAYLTIEKISEKFSGKEIPEKIILNKTYTTIGDMPHHDVRIPFSGSKAAYLSIHQDEEGNYFLTPYDIKIFINSTPLTESVCLRDKDFIQITEDYTYCFNYVKPINIIKTPEAPDKELSGMFCPLKPGKTAVLKKTARLEKMDRKDTEQMLSTEVFPTQDLLSLSNVTNVENLTKEEPKASTNKDDEESKEQFDLKTTIVEEKESSQEKVETIAAGSSIIDKKETSSSSEIIESDTSKTESSQEEKDVKDAKSSISVNIESSSPGDIKTESSLEEKVPAETEKPKDTIETIEKTEEKKGNDVLSSDTEKLPAELIPTELSSLPEKKVDLSLREKRVTSSFKKQKLVLRHAGSDIQKENLEYQEPKQETEQEKLIGKWKETLETLIASPEYKEEETNEDIKTAKDNVEDSKQIISSWKETLEGLISENTSTKTSSEVSSVSELVSDQKTLQEENEKESTQLSHQSTQKDLIGTWKQALQCIMEQAKEAEKIDFTPEDSKNLITNWKETLESLMHQAEKNIVQSPSETEEDNNTYPENMAFQEESLNQEEALVAEEASKEYLNLEEVNETEQEDISAEEWQSPSKMEIRGEALSSWKTTLQNLVEKSSKEKKVETESYIDTKIPQLKPPSSNRFSMERQQKTNPSSEYQPLEERKVREEIKPGDSKSESKKLRTLRKSDIDASKRADLEALRQSESSLEYSEPEMTLMWNTSAASEHSIHVSPRLISPSSGQILTLEKDLIFIGRSVSCDMCLVDEYISRQHLEFKRIPLGFIVKNIGKNDVFIEKRSQHSTTAEGKIPLEQKLLKPGESTLLLQEATIMIGSQILYYFSISDEKETGSESQIRERKFNFFKNLANQKKELLDAAQLQKTLIPPKVIFEDIQIGVWFKYMAINDLSGDFFLYHREGNSLYFCLGDVSGHGAAAALMASQLSGMFRILAQRQENVEGIAHAINENLFKAKRRTHNLYALVNILQVTANGIELCIAGNSVPPLYYNAKENEIISLDTPSTPTGLFTSNHFKTYLDILKFEKNDMLIMFTDGVTEAEMIDGSLLEYDKAQEFIQYQIQQNQPWEFFLDNFLIWLKQHCEIQDDLSIVLIGKLDK